MTLRKAFTLLLVVSIGYNPSNSNAAKKEQILVFLQSIACSSLPTGTCDALNPDNAKNILLTHQGVLAQRYCGSSNIKSSKQLLDLGSVSNFEKCKKLFEVIE